MLKTALHKAHLDLGAKMGEFASYDMPLYYPEGVIAEHEWVRGSCGVFDVSHMGQIIIEGEAAAEFWEHLTPSAFQPKKKGRAQYTVLLNEHGGIIDDLIITRLDHDKFFTVINAGCKDKDIAWIQSQLPPNLKFTYLNQNALIAVQGPKAETVMRDVLKTDVSMMPYMHLIEAAGPGGVPIFISRVGYTGEDGFEISIANEHAEDLFKRILSHDAAKPVGLAARDSLRLEMGYALYGHDIDTETSPVEAGLSWIISKKTSGYYGYNRIRKELEEGVKRKLVGVKLTGKGIAREGAEIRNKDDQKIGALTSGGFSPTLKQAIGQGYVETAQAEQGSEIFLNVRGRNIEAVITSLPHRPANTKSMKSKEAA